MQEARPAPFLLRPRSVLLGICAWSALAAAPRAQTTLDLIPVGMSTTQAIQPGFVQLSAGRSTCVRVGVRAFGTIPPDVFYDGVLHVYDGGVEVEGSPVYSQNGPLKPSATVNPNLLDGTLNFIFLPPESNDVLVVFEANPAGTTQIAEIDYSNNTLDSGTLAFHCRANPELCFVPIDYRPGGGSTPNPPDPDLIKPGVGDNFVHGIYPGADWEYHRSDAPAKLWTSSLADSFGGLQLCTVLASDMLLMNPVPDFIYGWVPGALPGYNGVSISIPGTAAIGNTEPIRFQRTIAHELGHLFGLQHNTATTNTIGIDVEHHLNLILGLPQLQASTQKDIMYAGLLTQEAWVWEPSYSFFQVNQAYVCPALVAASAPQTRLLLAGVHDRAKPELELLSAVATASAQATPFVPVSSADLILRIEQAGAPALELGLATRGSADLCQDGPAGAGQDGATDAPVRLMAGGFATLLPAGVSPDRVAFVDAASGKVMAELARSPAAPAAHLTALAPSAGGKLYASWEASDADGDALTSYLVYSPDGARRVPLATGVTGSEVEIDAESLSTLVPGSGFFELLVSDGLNTTAVRYQPSAADGAALGSGNDPWVYVLTPDSGKSYPKGATVILHSSGWDIEDRALGGTDITWASDLDGPIGVGRVASISNLSVGTHAITVQATDSDGQSSTANTTITITQRDLPGVPGLICQADIGFGGPGKSVLLVCGGDLSAGTTAYVQLLNAASLTPAFIIAGTSLNPTPLFGGLAVPIPPFVVVAGVTDAAGEWLLPDAVPGGAPASIYVQAGYLDAGQPQGVGISNAVRIDFP